MRRGPKPAKSKVEAKPPVARKSSKNDAARVRDLEKRLAEALERQTATGEILGVISSSPTNVQPVFDTIASSATRLCDALYSLVFRFDGETITLVAADGSSPERLDVIRSAYPAPPGRKSVAAQAILERQIIAIADAQSGTEYPHIAERAKAIGYRSILSVPMLRGDTAIGAINVVRVEAIPFTAAQIELLKTFADQAVIAIENVRLFKELEARNRDLTATGEILQVISRSPTNVQPVFDAIVTSGMRLLEGFSATLRRLVGDELHLAAFSTTSESGDEALKSLSRLPLADDPLFAQAVRDRVPCIVSDAETDPRAGSRRREVARARGYRGMLIVPMLRDDDVIGTITVTRGEPGPFTDEHIALLKTFADQAVIAIENVRLFSELQASNRELTTALDTQTATSDILRVISSSPTDVQPVFDAIVNSAVRLLWANTGVVIRIAGELIELAAFTSIDEAGDAVLRASFPRPVQSEGASAQAIRDRAPLNIADAHTDPRFPEAEHARARARGYRSRVVVPMLSRDQAIGAIGVTRREPGGFSDDEVALLQTFADQAVIAIENVRLFTELQEKNRALTHAHAQVTEALDQQTATSEILGVISSSPTDVRPVFETIASNARRLCNADSGAVYTYDGRLISLQALDNTSKEGAAALRRAYPREATLGTAAAKQSSRAGLFTSPTC